jgi:hypothetical protein
MDFPPVPYQLSATVIQYVASATYVTACEVTTLKHEFRNDAVEGRVCISETLLAGAESAEVLSSLWDYIVVEVEVDCTGLICFEQSASSTRKVNKNVVGKQQLHINHEVGKKLQRMTIALRRSLDNPNFDGVDKGS